MREAISQQQTPCRILFRRLQTGGIPRKETGQMKRQIIAGLFFGFVLYLVIMAVIWTRAFPP